MLGREGWACLMMGGVENQQQAASQPLALTPCPAFCGLPLPMGSDQLQTTLFSKNKHAYGIGGSFVAIKGNNRVFKKITLRFK